MNKAQSQVIEYLNEWHGGFADVGIHLDGIVPRVAGNVTAYFTGQTAYALPRHVTAVKELLNAGTLFLYREPLPPFGMNDYVRHYYVTTEAIENNDGMERVTEGW